MANFLIDVNNIKALQNHVEEMIDKHEDRIHSKGFMSIREAELMDSLKEKSEMLEEIERGLYRKWELELLRTYLQCLQRI